MGGAFNALRSNDLIWSFHVNNYLMGKPPKAFDLLYWNADQTRMAGAMHLWYLREFYKENKLSRGELQIGDVRIDLKKVETPIYCQAAKEDHIAPCRSVYKGAQLFGGPVTFMLAGSGHIAGVINPARSGKYQHWVREGLADSFEAWFEGAQERPGSWWDHWKAWLLERSGSLVPARNPMLGPLPPIEPAPGRYVRERA
jgi:polyhydroxyalkanoate synthase subunit PhaC